MVNEFGDSVEFHDHCSLRRTERHVRATKHPTEPRTSVSILVTKSKHRRNRVRAYNRIFYFKSIRVRRT